MYAHASHILSFEKYRKNNNRLDLDKVKKYERKT
jgi:hypothetical protein